jgi:hypothetical protein
MAWTRAQPPITKLDFTLEAKCSHCNAPVEIYMTDAVFTANRYTEQVVDDIGTGPRQVQTESGYKGIVYLSPCNNCCTVDESKSAY